MSNLIAILFLHRCHNILLKDKHFPCKIGFAKAYYVGHAPDQMQHFDFTTKVHFEFSREIHVQQNINDSASPGVRFSYESHTKSNARFFSTNLNLLHRCPHVSVRMFLATPLMFSFSICCAQFLSMVTCCYLVFMLLSKKIVCVCCQRCVQRNSISKIFIHVDLSPCPCDVSSFHLRSEFYYE